MKYARALAEVAAESELQNQVASDLEKFDSLLAESRDLRECLGNPAFTLHVKQQVVAEVARKIPVAGVVTNFLLLLVERNRHSQLTQIREAYQQVLDRKAGVVQADVESAQELPVAVRARLTAGLVRLTGGKVRLSYRIEPGLIAGIRVQIGSVVYDGSVQAELEQIRRELAV